MIRNLLLEVKLCLGFLICNFLNDGGLLVLFFRVSRDDLEKFEYFWFICYFLYNDCIIFFSMVIILGVR